MNAQTEIFHWLGQDLPAALAERFTSQIQDIFFLSSSRKDWPNETEKQQFFQRWTKYYFEHPDIWLAWDSSRRLLLGYLMGCRDSSKIIGYFQENLPSQTVFSDLFSSYPAHLHINCRPEARGAGIGSNLIARFKESLKQQRISGVHIITGPEEKNVSFYLKNDFAFKLERSWGNYRLLFLGARIEARPKELTDRA